MAYVGLEDAKRFCTSVAASFRDGMGYAAPIYKEMCEVIPVSTRFRAEKIADTPPDFEEIISNYSAYKPTYFQYVLKVRKFGKALEMTVDDINDDMVGEFSREAKQLGEAGRAHYDAMASYLLPGGRAAKCFDGQNFFSTSHPVTGAAAQSNLDDNSDSGNPWYLLDLSKSYKPLIVHEREELAMTSPNLVTDYKGALANEMIVMKGKYRAAFGYGYWQQAYMSRKGLDETNLEAALIVMNTRKMRSGKTLGVRATHLVCGPNNEIKARKLLASVNANGGFNVFGSNEVLGSGLKLIVNPYVEDLAAAALVAQQPEET